MTEAQTDESEATQVEATARVIDMTQIYRGISLMSSEDIDTVDSLLTMIIAAAVYSGDLERSYHMAQSFEAYINGLLAERGGEEFFATMDDNITIGSPEATEQGEPPRTGQYL